MVAWKAQLKPSQIAQVSSYLLTLQGTTPANPKAAEGDLWEDETTSGENTEDATQEDNTNNTNADENVTESTN
jgi:cytochrome c oxidase cbb3-type subunit 3